MQEKKIGMTFELFCNIDIMFTLSFSFSYGIIPWEGFLIRDFGGTKHPLDAVNPHTMRDRSLRSYPQHDMTRVPQYCHLHSKPCGYTFIRNLRPSSSLCPHIGRRGQEHIPENDELIFKNRTQMNLLDAMPPDTLPSVVENLHVLL